MKINIFFYTLVLSCVICLLSSCHKYLEASTDKKLVVISSLQDIQGLMDNNYTVNDGDPGAGESSSNDFYLTENRWAALDEYDRAMYTWQPDRTFPSYSVYFGNEWSTAYDAVYVANTVLDNLPSIAITSTNNTEWNNIKGQALFLRAKCFLQIAWVWSLAYDKSTATTDLGIPLRLNSDFNELSVRSTVQETYDRIILDLKEAVALLPDKPLHVLRASKAAAYGYLARTYLSMREYKNAGLYADSCLQLHHELLDFNTVTPPNPFPEGIGRFNAEVIYDCMISTSSMAYRGIIYSTLYDSYADNDRRKKIFFRETADLGQFNFRGSYEQGYDLFSGIATDEMYLIRAECFAREGQVQYALSDLNHLLEKRWETGTFIPFTAPDADAALDLILIERRKELLMRGLRWADLKRLNKEGRNIILTREIDGIVATLPPNDLRYALPIPDDIISISNMPQNPR